MVSKSLQKSPHGTYPAIEPDKTNLLFSKIQEIQDRKEFYGSKSVILVSPKIRTPFKKLVEMVFPQITVLSLNEIPADVKIKSEEVISF